VSSVLLLEDDRLFSETLQDFLEEEGFAVACALDPRTALELSYASKFDLYLFDVNLPFESGFDLLEKLRESGDQTPAIFLTSREDKNSLRDGFASGADDYLRKPVDLEELLLRMHAVLRRQRRSEYIYLGAYRLDCFAKVLSDAHSNPVEMSPKAADLLILLLEYQGAVVTLDQIKERLWAASESSSEGALRVYIAQIKKLFPLAIENVRGIGYLFDQTKVATSNTH